MIDSAPKALGGVWQVHEMAGVPAWMIVYFLLSVIFAFALRKPFGAQI